MWHKSLHIAGALAVLAVGAWNVPTADAGRIEFLVAEYPGQRQNGDSYVITIDAGDSERLAQARLLADWIDDGADFNRAPDGRIVVVSVAAGADGRNRDELASSRPLWSWHTVGEVSFVDASIEILDGWPGFVEQDVDGWIANTNGFVGFWSYTVVRELGPVVPEPESGLLAAMGLAGLIANRRRNHFRPPPSALRPPSSVLRPPLSALRSPSSVLRPPSSALRPPLSALPRRAGSV